MVKRKHKYLTNTELNALVNYYQGIIDGNIETNERAFEYQIALERIQMIKEEIDRRTENRLKIETVLDSPEANTLHTQYNESNSFVRIGK